MRIVLDTNVLLAGLFARGICEQLIDLCWGNAPRIVIVESDYILAEFAKNAETKFGVPVTEVANTVEKIRHRVEMVQPIDVAADACRDASDLPILGTAVAGNADYLITGDRDLLSLKLFQSIPVISPREFYDLIRAAN